MSHRERQKEWQSKKRKLTSVDVSYGQLTETDNSKCQFLCKAKQSKAKYNIPPKSPKGDCVDVPQDDSQQGHAEGGSGKARRAAQERRAEAVELAGRIEQGEAFGRMRVNTAKLVRCLVSVLKKSTAAEVLDGLARWTERWKSDDWRYVPGRITDWLIDGKFLEEPRAKEEPVDHYRDVGNLENI